MAAFLNRGTTNLAPLAGPTASGSAGGVSGGAGPTAWKGFQGGNPTPTANPLSAPPTRPGVPAGSVNSTWGGTPGGGWGNQVTTHGGLNDFASSLSNGGFLQSSGQQPPAAAPAPGTTATSAPGEGYGPGTGEQYGTSHLGQYDQPTDFETFAQQQMNGNNPYYQRLQQQGDASINQQMAARGHYNSGGALSALGNYNGALGAAQFQDMGNLLQGAGSMQLQRQGQGQEVANSVQGQQQGRLAQQYGELSDIAHLGAGNVGGFYSQGGQQSGDAAMAGINAGANAAGLTGAGQNSFANQGLSLLGGIVSPKKPGT